MSISSAVARLRVERAAGGTYTLADQGGAERASMAISGIAARAEIVHPDGLVIATRQGWGSVIAQPAAGETTMRLDPQNSHLFDGSPARWRIRGRWRSYEGALLSEGRSMSFRLKPFSGRSCDIQVDGEWPELGAVALVACYALLVRRKRDQIIMVTAGH